ncbi:MAG: hypothetical protein JST30_08910 [Armatimonadetes bacterium]|nr:hypothetical protein [Armatimonadota bacterium]
MPVPEPLLKAVGRWTGSSRLNLPYLPEGEQVEESASTLTVTTDQKQTYATVDITWSTKGDDQTGRILVAGGEDGNVSAGWSDSWHQSGGVMSLVGNGMTGPTKVTGAFSAGEGPDWGWRIEFWSDGPDAFQMKMFVITPDGEETWAVQGDYVRA